MCLQYQKVPGTHKNMCSHPFLPLSQKTGLGDSDLLECLSSTSALQKAPPSASTEKVKGLKVFKL